MKSVSFSFLFLLLVACAAVPPQKVEPSKYSCNVDADCVCGGVDKTTGDCFVGNKLYAAQNVDFSRDCPDFCTGIAGQFETKCVSKNCMNVPREGWNKPVACTEEAKICPDGSAVGRVGPNCEFAPCPVEKGVECSSNADCVPAQCCHATSCVPASQAPDCTGMMCTMECRAGTIDCYGGCECRNNKCIANLAASEVVDSELSNAHWLCEDGSWKEAPEQCYDNSCFQKSDCQLMGVKGPCGPYMIAGPTQTLHKPPVFYAERCGADKCSLVEALCAEQQPRMTGFDCENAQCVIRYAE